MAYLQDHNVLPVRSVVSNNSPKEMNYWNISTTIHKKCKGPFTNLKYESVCA